MAFFKTNRGSKKSDIELIALYKSSGDPALVSQLYDRYIELVFGLCLKYLKDKSQSEDRVMEIYQILTEKLKTHNVENFKSWLYIV